ncbi:MAG: phage shock protein A [Deltaproteobacteria bacterium]|nr:phage shock protein A [Deltaproteobacteria bacterium]
MANLFVRIHEIITANINEMIDRVEDPERMIKQMIREMEESIARAKEGVIDAIASEKQLQKDLELRRRQSTEWMKKAEDALHANREDLARAALMRKKEYDSIIQALEPAWESARATSEHLKKQLQALEAKLDEAKRKRTMLIARQRAAQAQEYMGSTMSHFKAGLAAHETFTRMEGRVSEMEARAEAMNEVNNHSSQLEKEVSAMEIELEVENELAELKKKVDGEQMS